MSNVKEIRHRRPAARDKAYELEEEEVGVIVLDLRLESGQQRTNCILRTRVQGVYDERRLEKAGELDQSGRVVRFVSSKGQGEAVLAQ